MAGPSHPVPAGPGAPVLLTGLSGYIARHTALQLLQQGVPVRGTVRRLAQAPALRAQLADAAAAAAAEGSGAPIDLAGLQIVAAELGSDAGWATAMAGCRGVLHMASPYPLQQPRERLALVPEARDGTLRVLAAARAAGVPRVVLTSSLVAVMAGQPVPPGRVFTAADWSDPDAPLITPYAVSKTLAERAAWAAVGEGGASRGDGPSTAPPDNRPPELAVINPGFVLGPCFDGDGGASAAVIRMMLEGRYPGVPRMHLPTVDVRDVAAAHIAALQSPTAAGQRFLLAERTLSLLDMARLLAEAVPERRGKCPKLELPDWLVRVVAKIDRNVGAAVPELGKAYQIDNRPVRELLGRPLRDARLAVADSGRSLVEQRAPHAVAA